MRQAPRAWRIVCFEPPGSGPLSTDKDMRRKQPCGAETGFPRSPCFSKTRGTDKGP